MEFKIKNIKEGMRVEGKVFQVKDNEVIVDIGYSTEGTIYLDNLTKKNVSSAKEIVKEGDIIEAIVRKKDDEKGIVLLSRIEIENQESFDKLQDMFQNEETFEVEVKGTNKGGLVVTAMGTDMFMPASEVQVAYTEDLGTFVGKKLEVQILEISRKKVVVSHKIVEKEAQKIERKQELETISVGDVLEGTVSKILPFGAFVRFDQVEGLLHISEISHHNVKKVEDVLKEGQTVKVKVIDATKTKRSLSMKALEPTPWEAFEKAHKPGDKVTGKIVKKMQFGMLVEVERNVVGMINKNDYSWDPRFNLAGEVNVGDEVEVQILSIDTKARKMALSKKHLDYNPWQDVKVKVGQEVSGTVKSIQSNGALIEVQGVNAYLPISEIKDERVENVEHELKPEEVINAIVLKFNSQDWQMVISKKQYDEKQVRDEYKKYLKSENKQDQSQTLGELFADKFKKLK